MLNELRTQIDQIDRQLLALFEQRMQVCRKVGQYKKEQSLPVYDHGREMEILRRKVEQLTDKSLEQPAQQLFEKLMELSRNLQTDIIRGTKSGTVAYAGIPGSYAEEALLKYFGNTAKPIHTDTFKGVFELLEDGKADYGILPVENTSTGSVLGVLDLLYKYQCYIVGEEILDINQYLLGVKGSSLKDIREVYSHDQGLGQCADFLAEHPQWKQIPYLNTAISAQYVAQQGDASKAAIASKRCAELYGLDVLQANINFKKSNHTRFIVVGHEMEATTVSSKVSVMFTLSHKSGTLYHALECFAKYNLNLLHIESRPLSDRNFEYMFYVDLEGNIYNDSMKDALDSMRQECAYFRVLGCY